MEFVASYLASLILFLIIDVLWIKTVMRPIFERSIGSIMLEDPRMGPAAAFFLVYLAGVTFFAVVPAVEVGSWTVAALHGMFLGIIAYGTYDATNFATLKGWTLKMSAIDTAWGGFISAIAATAGYFVVQAMS